MSWDLISGVAKPRMTLNIRVRKSSKICRIPWKQLLKEGQADDLGQNFSSSDTVFLNICKGDLEKVILSNLDPQSTGFNQDMVI